MTVNPQHFVKRMSKRWTEELHGTTTPKLQEAWLQLVTTFNNQTAASTTGWNVLQLPTGTGKTQSLYLYCSMLPNGFNNFGTLIVTRFKTEADNIAATINTLSGEVRAVSYHTDNKDAAHVLSYYPVLVVTHKAYEMAIADDHRWSMLNQWQHVTRRLTVIDEQLNIVKQTQLTLDQIRFVQGSIPTEIATAASNDFNNLTAVIAKLNELDSLSPSGRTIHNAEWGLNDYHGFDKLIKALRRSKLDHSMLDRNDEDERKAIRNRHAAILRSLQIILADNCWYALKGKHPSLTKAAIDLPPSRMNAVVMDATASNNIQYKLLGDDVNLIAPPADIRSYRNVRLHTSRGHKVGKIVMRDNAERDAGQFITSLTKTIASDRKVFICTHKAVKPHLEGYDNSFVKYSIGHWGAIDGKNQWQDHDTAVIYGLPYMDNIAPEVMLQAFETRSGKQMRPSDRPTLLKVIVNSHLTVSLIQGINRIHCRQVTDAQGNCKETDVYLLLPDRKTSGIILPAIIKAMPNIELVNWASTVSRRKVRRSGYEKPLIALLEQLIKGKHKAKDIRDKLGITKRNFEKLITKTKDESTQLWHDLTTLNVSYHASGVGRSAQSWFEKV